MTIYNEIEKYPAQWLRNLVAAGHIAEGTVDERSIKELNPGDLAGHTQCHFFAGIGVWSYALRKAGWPDDAPVWTGSCPCQPFSSAGKGLGFADPRHLWPVWFELIKQCRPPVIFGEQVASKDGLAWLDLVQSDLEGAGYSFAAVDICAAGVGAPHIRQRLYWVANANQVERGSRRDGRAGDGRDAARVQLDGLRATRLLAQPYGQRVHHVGPGETGGSPPPLQGDGQERKRLRSDAGECGHDVCGSMADSSEVECRQGRTGEEGNGRNSSRVEPNGLRATNGFWADCDWLPCKDGKARPVEPGSFPLASGVANSVGRIRAAGNAIVAPLAATFIRAAIEAIAEQTQ